MRLLPHALLALDFQLQQRLNPVAVGCALFAEDAKDDVLEAAPDEAVSAQSGQGPTNNFQGLHAGYTLVASVLLGLGLGYGIDVMADSFPWGMIGGALFFIVAGLYQVVKEFTK